MFSSFNSVRAVVTLFHSPTSSASRRILQFLKIHAADTKIQNFDLQVTEANPTKDQLKTILNYVGQAKIGAIVPGAGTYNEAAGLLEKGSSLAVLRPMVVDWVNGKAVLGDDEEGVKKLVAGLEHK
ncbi:thioredoxin-like protein [Limtongia smithiae]|uniref:thioredoxin-like protein n=1 Tax=Limtongia smithiae TaxID=1125753 RepID=UPI0034CF08DA